MSGSILQNQLTFLRLWSIAPPKTERGQEFSRPQIALIACMGGFELTQTE
jgi:hypothetical protein